jgi:hypothetical protein
MVLLFACGARSSLDLGAPVLDASAPDASSPADAGLTCNTGLP